MKRTYQGSCHCGAVRFDCDIDLDAETSKCNCSICTKARFWKAIVKADAFRLRHGQEDLTDYRFGSETIHHLFCRHCGVKSFARGQIEALGGTFYAINLACLDDASPDELTAAPIIYEDGRRDNWQSPPADIRHL
ncbi:MAG: GFA family protein [Dongiaceae bacterium]